MIEQELMYRQSEAQTFDAYNSFHTRPGYNYAEPDVQEYVVRAKPNPKPTDPVKENKYRKNYKDRFRNYLAEKERTKDPCDPSTIRKMDEELKDTRVDFDRYQCTSKNPKRIKREYEVRYDDKVAAHDGQFMVNNEDALSNTKSRKSVAWRDKPEVDINPVSEEEMVEALTW